MNTTAKTTTKLSHADILPFKMGKQAGSINHCAICEKAVGNSPLLVEIYAGGLIWDASRNGEPDQNDAGYMGHYPIGLECAKKFAADVLKEGVAA